MGHQKYFLQSSAQTIAKARELRKRMTPEEKTLWRCLRKKSIGARFRKQTPFGPFILDFFTCEKRIAIELDGNRHFGKEGKMYDAARDEYLASHGIRVFRFKNSEVRSHLAKVLSRIQEIVGEKE